MNSIFSALLTACLLFMSNTCFGKVFPDDFPSVDSDYWKGIHPGLHVYQHGDYDFRLQDFIAWSKPEMLDQEDCIQGQYKELVEEYPMFARIYSIQVHLVSGEYVVILGAKPDPKGVIFSRALVCRLK